MVNDIRWDQRFKHFSSALAEQSIFEKYSHVEKVIIYGSRAKGNYKTGSDIDLTMLGDSITDRDRRDIFLS